MFKCAENVASAMIVKVVKSCFPLFCKRHYISGVNNVKFQYGFLDPERRVAQLSRRVYTGE